MLVGMMVVGASAADFPDSDKIEHTDAVNTMVALGIIKGKDDGNFDPEGIVTRAEMAKMMCVAMNGGKDPNLSGGGSYPDTVGHWAAGYIDYCTNLGIVSGDNKGNFNPNATVTGTEAAKMILIALGYNAETEGYVNDAKWDINIGVDANAKDLYKDVAVIASAGLSRDNAAQMIYNGLNAKMVDYKIVGIAGGNGLSQAYDLDETLVEKKFELNTEYSYLVSTSYDSKKNEYTYGFDSVGLTNKLGPTVSADVLDVSSLKSATDYSDLFGMKVKVLYKKEGSKTTVYGIYADSKVLASGVWGDATNKADTLKVDGVTYDKNTGCVAVDFNTGATSTMKNSYAFDAIDNNDDGKIDVIVAHPFTVGKVSFVGKDSITAGNVSYKFDDCDIYDGVAKDDVAIVTAKANNPKSVIAITKADKVTGDIGAVNADGDWRVDGSWYSASELKIDGSSWASMTAGDSVDMYLVNGYVAFAKVSEGTAISDVLYVAASTGTAGDAITAVLGENKGVDTRVFLADGTNQVVKAMRVDVTTESDGVSDADSDLVKVVPAPGLYTYKVNKNSVYELKAVKAGGTHASVGGNSSGYVFDAANLPGSTSLGSASTSNATYNKSDSKIGSYFIADDAVIYLMQTVNNGAGSGAGTAAGEYTKGKVVSGKELKTMNNWGDNASVLYKAVSGLSTVQVGVIYDDDLYGGTDVSTGYGYITKSGYAEKNADGDWNIKFTAWTKDGEAELTATAGLNGASLSATDAAAYAAGSFISYTNTATEGEITDMKDLLADGTNTIANGMETAITGYDGDKNIAFDGTAYQFKSDNKSVVIFVDTANKAGIEGGSIETAQNPTGSVYIKNAVAMASTSDGVDVLFVDTANKLATASYTVTHDTAAVTGAETKVAADATVKVGDTTVNTGDAVKAGSTVTVTLADNSSSPVTADAGDTITVTVALAYGNDIVKTIHIAKGATFTGGSVSFEMPAANVTGITVTVDHMPA